MGNPTLDAFDEALADVAKKEYRRLREGLHGCTRASRIDGALESLELLQGGQEPLYHDWDSLFYVTWYQPRQVHLPGTGRSQRRRSRDRPERVDEASGW